MKKNMQQLPKPRHAFLSNVRQMTIQNNLNPVYVWFKTVHFKSKLLLGENGLLTRFNFLLT